MARVLVASAEPLGERMAGPAIRALELARALAGANEVSISAPGLTALPDSRIRPVDAGFEDYERLSRAVDDAEIVVAQALPARLLSQLPSRGVELIADLYNPTVFEVLEAGREKGPAARRRQQRTVARAAGSMLAAASRVMCASEPQRDLWLGMMASLGRIPLEAYDSDPSFRSFIDVVPFGIPAQPPVAAGPDPVREMFPAIAEGDLVLLWGGGAWNWLDPETAIDAVGLLDARRGGRPPVHLVFMGIGRPATGELDAMAGTGSMLAHLERSGLEGRRVHVNRGWVPYDQRAGWLLASDAALCTHRDHLESRLAFRTRMLDAIWAGLPIVATTGDELALSVEVQRLGAVAPPGDAPALAAAIEALVDDPQAVADARANLGRAASLFTWERCAAPLAAWCERPGGGLPPDRSLLRRLTLAQYPEIVAETAETDGVSGAARRLWSNLARMVRRRR